jgi:ABC-type branched-subunit amino acid transport system ATPase component
MTDSSAQPILSVEGLRAGYGETDVLRDVHIRVDRGTVVTVIGPNGAGKSTLLKAIYGVLQPRAGRVAFAADDRVYELAGMPPHRITAAGMNYVPQLANVFPRLSIQENIEIGATPLPRRAVAARVGEILALFPVLAARSRDQAAVLSGGQRQMLALARALVTDPKLLLLDEPSAGLAPNVVDEVFRTIAEVNATGVALLIVEQNARRSLALSHYGYVLDMGENRFEGAGPALLHDPQVANLYLGGAGRLAAAVRD